MLGETFLSASAQGVPLAQTAYLLPKAGFGEAVRGKRIGRGGSQRYVVGEETHKLGG